MAHLHTLRACAARCCCWRAARWRELKQPFCHRINQWWFSSKLHGFADTQCLSLHFYSTHIQCTIQHAHQKHNTSRDARAASVLTHIFAYCVAKCGWYGFGTRRIGFIIFPIINGVRRQCSRNESAVACQHFDGSFAAEMSDQQPLKMRLHKRHRERIAYLVIVYVYAITMQFLIIFASGRKRNHVRCMFTLLSCQYTIPCDAGWIAMRVGGVVAFVCRTRLPSSRRANRENWVWLLLNAI